MKIELTKILLKFPGELEKAKKMESCMAITFLMSAFTNEILSITQARPKVTRRDVEGIIHIVEEHRGATTLSLESLEETVKDLSSRLSELGIEVED